LASNGHWLDTSQIEAALAQQGKLIGEGSHAFSNHLAQIFALQKHADLLIEISDLDHLQVEAAKFTNNFPKGRFPISKLKEYFLPQSATGLSIALAVVVMPDTFIIEEGKPTPVQLVRRIDRVLLAGGVKRRVYESIGNGRFYKLDSGDAL
jgi:hypothetical protein